MAALKTRLRLLVVIAVGVGCAAAVKKEAYLFHQDGPTAPVYLVSDHWHAGVVIKISDIPGDLLPESHDFPEADYLEFGWGDWDFYQAPTFNLGYAIKATLFPTKSVLHVVGFSGPVVNYAPYREIIQFRPSSRNFERLAGYIDESFARLGTGAAVPLGRGLYGNSRFYPARGKFHLFNTHVYLGSPCPRGCGLFDIARRHGGYAGVRGAPARRCNSSGTLRLGVPSESSVTSFPNTRSPSRRLGSRHFFRRGAGRS